METKSNRNYIIEFLRVIFTLGVVVGHTFHVFFMNKNNTYNVVFHISSVDFFFIVSAFFMAGHFGSLSDNVRENFPEYIIGKLKRTFSLLLIATIVEIPSTYLIHHYIEFRKWTTLLFIGDLGNFDGWGPIWYLTVLFWGTLFVGYFLNYHRRFSVYLLCPIVIFLSLMFLSQYGCLNEGRTPLIGKWFSTGIVRGLCDICFGVEAYHISNYIKKNADNYTPFAIKIISIFVEVIFILSLIYQMVKQNHNSFDFFFLFSFSAYLILLRFNKSYVLRVFNHKMWGDFAKITGVIYVTHLVVIKQMNRLVFMHNLKDLYVYIIICMVSIVFATIVYFIEKKVRKIMATFFLANK